MLSIKIMLSNGRRMNHFRVAFYLCFKTRPGAQQMIEPRNKGCPYEKLCTKARFDTEVNANRKWLIENEGSEALVYSSPGHLKKCLFCK